ncbi:GNAT family N-acetyltransferase [Pontibacter cellulosilyticus]|uniref:GNAT family N-acetyltransferase n=1 Tax=Pontibacter cellulosilyticus TaxID=1720253 RepID=A0A923N4H8_9BACT|nr:GNAT family N-acetyltransferase [Pontibacter cellulosilyticus]MBC5992076.1 GNAT family N-acetyltransferase [Pontibacter cellulosilyticus]
MIRPYLPEDKAQLVALLQLNIPQYFAETEEADFVEYLDKHLEDYFVFEDENKILGAGGINYFYDTNLTRISWDIVHPEHQGKGIGRKLLTHRINHIKAIPSIKTIQVRTSQLVYRFYEKMGFDLELVDKDYWAKGFDLYQMKMPLNTL